ncbi:hypothetical protein [Lysinibacillus sp. fls2-241-R2A-57]
MYYGNNKSILISPKNPKYFVEILKTRKSTIDVQLIKD